MEFVDTHCHLQFPKLAGNIDGVMDRALAAGVSRMICVGTSLEDSRQAVEYAARFENVWAAVGAHPHDGKEFDYETGGQILAELAGQPKVVAIGEIGLDFYKDYSPRDEQEKLFRLQLEAGQPSGLPFIFHVRDAWRDFWRIMEDYKDINAVVHSFTAGQKQLDKILEKGWFVGLNGITTFTRDHAQLDAIKQVPLTSMMLETDAPFLTPAPDRDETCEPRHVRATAEFLAGLRSEPLEELSKASTENAIGLFGLK
ncbi:TatD family hydrolase [Candidatus Saccharibacteria bacterium]|nr:TatD family hydrolase [Candidatus Saccharibacteria bacterium]